MINSIVDARGLSFEGVRNASEPPPDLSRRQTRGVNELPAIVEAKHRFFEAIRAKGVSPRTEVSYREAIDQFLGHYLSSDPERTLVEVEAHHIEAFLALLRAAGRADSTVDNRYRSLRRWFRWLLSQKLIPRDPVKGVQAPMVRPGVVKPYTEEEVRRMMAETRHWPDLALRDQTIISVLYNTGIRAGELCTLRGVNVTDGVLLVMGKGKKERRVGVEPVTRRLLATYTTTREEQRYVFSLSVTGLHQMIKRVAWRAKVPDAHAHRFRDTFAVTFLENGGDLETLQTILGHSNIETTLRYVRYGRERRAVEAQQKYAPFARTG